MELETICNELNEKYNLEELLDGTLEIGEVLSDADVVNFLSCNKYRLEDVENYILKNMI